MLLATYHPKDHILHMVILLRAIHLLDILIMADIHHQVIPPKGGTHLQAILPRGGYPPAGYPPAGYPPAGYPGPSAPHHSGIAMCPLLYFPTGNAFYGSDASLVLIVISSIGGLCIAIRVLSWGWLFVAAQYLCV